MPTYLYDKGRDAFDKAQTIKFILTDPVEVQMFTSCLNVPMVVAWIYELDNPNPLLHLRHPLGVNAVRNILDGLEDMKKELEKTDEGWKLKGL